MNNPAALANKVWRKAVAEDNRLILNNCSQEDIAVFIADNNWRTIKETMAGMVNAIVKFLEFKKVQENKLKQLS